MSKPKTTIGIIGLGLIGGSLALRLKQLGLSVVGFDINPITTKLAQRLEIPQSQSLVDCLKSSRVVCLCLPIDTTCELLSHWPLNQPQLVTDTCSVKEVVIQASASLPKSVTFIPGHPMAGKEISGLTNADPTLFVSKTWVLTPLPHAAAKSIKLLTCLIKFVGANVVLTSARQHDQAASRVSHLPHLLASTFVSTLSASKSWPLGQKIAATGFKDFSRLAEDNPSMHLQIVRHNSSNILGDITAFENHLQIFKTAIQDQNFDLLIQLFISAQTARANWRKHHVR